MKNTFPQFSAVVTAAKLPCSNNRLEFSGDVSDMKKTTQQCLHRFESVERVNRILEEVHWDVLTISEGER